MVLGGTVAVAQSAATEVQCTITDNVLSCPLPESAPVTVTETAAADPVTVTASATVTETAAPVTETATVTPDPVTVTATSTVTATAQPTTASPTTSTVQPAPTTSAPSTPPPPSSEWPGADNTGVPAGVTLTPSGPLTVTVDGTVIDGKEISGAVVVKAKSVVIKNSRIKGTDFWGVHTEGSGSVVLQDSEIIGFSNALGFSNWQAYRVEISGQRQDGVKFGSNTVLQDSWIHAMNPEPGSHTDGGQLQSGEVNVLIRHNVIDVSGARGNAALFLAPDLGPSTNGPITVDNNKLNGGNYTLYCVDGDNGKYFVKNISITNNRFGRTYQYGPASVNVPITQSGNVWDNTGAALSL